MAGIPPIFLSGLLMVYKIYVSVNESDYLLGSHKFYPLEKIFTEMNPAMLHRNENNGGLIIQLYEVSPKVFQIVGFDNIYKMGGWKLYVDIDEQLEYSNVVFHKKLYTNFNIIQLPDAKYLIKVQNKDLYLYLNINNKRDINSYYLYAKKYDDLDNTAIFNINAIE